MRVPFIRFEAGSITRQTLFVFTLASAVINGLVTASVGAWLARKYASLQTQRQSVNALSQLYYERRIRAGLVVSTLRRGGEIEELRHRKRDYDATFVDWNKSIRGNLFAIREVLGERDVSNFEEDFQQLLVKPLSQIDLCLTKGYDARLAGQDPLPLLEACRWAQLYQLSLDCGAAYTNELYKMTRVTFNPLSRGPSDIERSESRAKVNKECATAPAP